MNSDLDSFLQVSGTEVRQAIGRCCTCYQLVFPDNWTLKGLAACTKLPITSQTASVRMVLKPVCDRCVMEEPAVVHYWQSLARPGDVPGTEYNQGDR